MAKLELDIAIDFNDKAEWKAEFVDILAEHNLVYEVLAEVGPAGGWPCVEISGERSDIEKYLVVYCGGDKDHAEDYHEWIED